MSVEWNQISFWGSFVPESPRVNYRDMHNAIYDIGDGETHGDEDTNRT